VTGEELFRETVSLVSTRRGLILSTLLGAGFALLWRTMAWRAEPGEGLIVALIGVTVLVVVLTLTRAQLSTTVRRDAVLVELGRGDKRTLRAADLRGVTVGAFDPTVDDDGWGTSRGVRPSLAWGPTARRGVWLERNEQPALFLPSSRPRELASAIRSIL
jgi:hypothetical protein